MNETDPAKAGGAALHRYYNVRLHHNRHLIVAIDARCVATMGRHRRHWEITDTVGRRWLTDYDTTTYREPLTADAWVRGDAVMLVAADGALALT